MTKPFEEQMEMLGDFFQRAQSNIPKSDAQYIEDFLRAQQVPDNFPALDLRKKYCRQLAFNRLANRICSHCGDKFNVTKLLLCQGCCLDWYCSVDCQRKHFEVHRRRCGRVEDGPLDEGYQAIAFLPVETKK